MIGKFQQFKLFKYFFFWKSQLFGCWVVFVHLKILLGKKAFIFIFKRDPLNNNN